MSQTSDGSDWRNQFDQDDAQNGDGYTFVRLSSMEQPDSLVVEFTDDGEVVTKDYDSGETDEVRFSVTVEEIDGRVLDANDTPLEEGDDATLDVGQASLISDLRDIDDLTGKKVQITVDKSGQYNEYSGKVVSE